MEKKDLFTHMQQLEDQVGGIHQYIGELKQEIVQLLEENKRLTIENQQLRKLLRRDPEPPEIVQEQEQTDKAAKEAPIVGEGYDNLARLYQEGFHICNVHYGHLRTEKDCLFCLSFLNK
ncbi:DNA replication initiation control protein YabA [Paenibacillus sp. GYB004]|uniref:DNA replication initiation control protein YabA n=1 Tax=unclassified Paenibacillus TaxID=185978 RepID=UPI002F968793